LVWPSIERAILVDADPDERERNARGRLNGIKPGRSPDQKIVILMSDPATGVEIAHIDVKYGVCSGSSSARAFLFLFLVVIFVFIVVEIVLVAVVVVFIFVFVIVEVVLIILMFNRVKRPRSQKATHVMHLIFLGQAFTRQDYFPLLGFDDFDRFVAKFTDHGSSAFGHV
jgi:Flp pilus assembly protein TadB